MKQNKHLSLSPFLAICLAVVALALPPSVSGAATTSLYQGQGGAWDTAVPHDPWTYNGYDIVNAAEMCPVDRRDQVLLLGTYIIANGDFTPGVNNVKNMRALFSALGLQYDERIEPFGMLAFLGLGRTTFDSPIQDMMFNYENDKETHVVLLNLRNTNLTFDDLRQIFSLPEDSAKQGEYSSLDQWHCTLLGNFLYPFSAYTLVVQKNPANKANKFQITPWVSKLDDSDPYHDWYQLNLKVFHDANLSNSVPGKTVTFMPPNRGGIVGWYANYRDIVVKSGDADHVFLLDWSPKTEAETTSQTTEQGSSWGCSFGPTLGPSWGKEGPSFGATLGAECEFGFSSSVSISQNVPDAKFSNIETQLWDPDQPKVPDSVSWNEDINGWNGDWNSTLPKIASQDYQSDRMLIWETSQPMDGALLDLFMWAGFEFDLGSREYANRMCLGITPGPADLSKGCLTGYNGNQITVSDKGEPFRLVQYRPPVIPLTQQPTSTSPVWVNDKVTVTFDGVKDPDGDYLLYQFDFGDGTFYPSSDCAKNPAGDGCQDKVCYDVCVDRACGSTQEDCLTVKCDTDGCFGPSLTAQHAWTHSKASDLMGVKAVRVRAAEAQCFPTSPTDVSECVKKAQDYGISNNYNYKSGWSGSFPVTIQGLSSISIDGPVSGDLSDGSTWTMNCKGKWYNQGTPFDEDCSACNEGLTWAVTNGAGNPTQLAAIDPSGLLQVNTLLEGKTIDNIMVKASCKDHGVTKADSISLAIKSAAAKPTNAPNGTQTGWQNIAIAALALFALLSLILFAWIGWRWNFKPKRKQQK